MSNIKVCLRNILVWSLAGSFWTFIGLQTFSLLWFSIIMFMGGGPCFLNTLLNIGLLIRYRKSLNRLDNFPDILR